MVRTTRRSLAVVALAVAATAASIVGVSDAPAGAVEAPIGMPGIPPTTWVDDEGRQLVLASAGFDADGFALTVARDLPSGQPDPTWGDDPAEPGVARVPIVPPAGVTAFDPVVATDVDGVVTIVWRDPSCGAIDRCSRWFARYDAATGAPVGAPTLVADAPRPLVSFRDGSFLAGIADDAATDLDWIWSDGFTMNESILTGIDPVAADTTLCCILIVDGDGHLERWVEGFTSPDLELQLPCLTDELLAIGADPDGGFAVACRIGEEATLTVLRYDADGSLAWSTDATATTIGAPERVAIDDLDRVWVGGRAGRFLPPPFAAGTILVAAVTEAGAQPPAYERATSRSTGSGTVEDIGGGVYQLRPVGDAVAIVDLQACCRAANNTYADSVVHGQILPTRPSPPACLPGAPLVASAGAGTVQLWFTPCAEGREAERPVDYLVEVTGSDGTRSAIVSHPADGSVRVADIDDLRGGTLLRTSIIARNAEGSSLAGPRSGPSTVLPFRSVDAFTFRMYNTLLRDIWWDRDGPALVASVASGDTAPVDLVVDLLDDGVAEARVEPVARLYLAVLGRHPDSGGLRYWIGRSEAGERLARIAERMASSPEFQRRYGGLSDRGFVLQVYRNVLGREGDPAGVDYWTRRLASRQLTRGGLVTQFSQSSEHIRRTDPTIQPLAATFLLLDRVTTAGERTAWATATPRATATAAILESEAFAAKVAN